MTQHEWDEFKKRVLEKMDSADHARVKKASFNVSYFPVSGSDEEVLGEGCFQIAEEEHLKIEECM